MSTAREDEIQVVLGQLGQRALAGLAADEARAAFDLWQRTNAGLEPAEARAAFAAEAAFAAAARALLESRSIGHPEAFPHIYASPLFAWFVSPGADEQALVAALVADGRPPGELLGWLYQFAVPEPVRKRLGQFYTSPLIVAHMLDQLGFRGPATLTGRLIDPACGAGAFLSEATRRALAAAAAAGLEPAATYRVVQQAVHGLDLNPLGVLLTEAALALELADVVAVVPAKDPLPPLGLYVTDSLRRGDGEGYELHAAAAEELKACRGEYARGFDWVVANPPYAKIPSRELDDAQRRRFSETTYGHPNLYGLFLQVGVELTAEEGRLCFINPKSFVSGLYFRNLRRFLARELDLERFETFAARQGVFAGVLQELVIVGGAKRPKRSATVELAELAVGAAGLEVVRRARVPRASALLGESFDQAFFVEPDALAHRVLARLAEAPPLKEQDLEVTTGTIVWNRLKGHVVEEDAGALPLVWGNGIRPFRFLGLGNRQGTATHLRLDERTERLAAQGEALLVKRLTAKEERRRLVACRLPATLAQGHWFAENHVNVVRASGPDAPDLDGVLALLNSRLYDYVFRALNGNTQVSATELELLPLKQGPELAQLAEIARRLAVAPDDAAAWRVLDEAACDIYGLDADERAAVLGGD